MLLLAAFAFGDGTSLVRGRDVLKALVVGCFRAPPAIANPVQADIRGNSIEKARRILSVQPRPSLEDSEEDVLAGIPRFILVP